MKIAIVGSRDYTNEKVIFNFLKKLPEDTTVVSGGAKGADTVAVNLAKTLGFPAEVIKPEWDAAPVTTLKVNKQGKYYDPAAGLKRNLKIVEASDELVAFWDGTSRGTLHAINAAKDANKPVKVFDKFGNEIPLDTIPKFESKKK